MGQFVPMGPTRRPHRDELAHIVFCGHSFTGPRPRSFPQKVQTLEQERDCRCSLTAWKLSPVQTESCLSKSWYGSASMMPPIERHRREVGWSEFTGVPIWTLVNGRNSTGTSATGSE